jgi:hypothetical protein
MNPVLQVAKDYLLDLDPIERLRAVRELLRSVTELKARWSTCDGEGYHDPALWAEDGTVIASVRHVDPWGDSDWECFLSLPWESGERYECYASSPEDGMEKLTAYLRQQGWEITGLV